MESRKKHLIFDLDDTLWDYKKNSNEVLLELYEVYNLGDFGIKINSFLNAFRDVNNQLWDQFDKGIITSDIIREKRFTLVFEKLSFRPNGVAQQIQDSFMKICPTKTRLVEGAKEVLEQLRSNYKFHILSNGFEEIQIVKLKSAGIHHYFDKIITSGRVGFRKPQPEIFEFALREIGATKEECVMIGDNPESDILGAYRYGIDSIYYNTHNKKCSISPNYTINNLTELFKIL